MTARPTLDPHRVIVPIFAVRENGTIRQFLGTGSFVGSPPLLLTADHVIRDWRERFAISTLLDLGRLYPAQIAERDPAHDLALLRVEGYEPPKVLALAEQQEPLHLNHTMVTYEYGTTITAGNQITLSPATRLGNITRVFNMTHRLGPAGEDALELSFPALRGASGAPVVSNNGLKLHGVLVANVSYHLLPAQIESVLDEGNQIFEETRFMLPQAIAVHVKHVRAFLRRVQPE